MTPNTPNARSAWFPGTVTPVRDGVYLRELHGLFFHSRFLCGKWRRGVLASAIFAPKLAVEEEVLESRHQCAPWCGLSRDPLQS